MIAEPINIFFLVPPNQLGGCMSFTVHLFRTFEQMGYEPRLYRVGKVPKAGFPVKPFKYGLTITTVDLGTARQLACTDRSLIAYAFWKKEKVNAAALMALGTKLIIHDPAEFHDDEMDFMKSIDHRPLVIRKRNVTGLKAHGIAATYVPHPYVPTEVDRAVEKKHHAICIARVDFRKRSHWIIEANKRLPGDHHVHLYGEMNRIYEYHQLRKEHPDWRNWYGGMFPDVEGAAVRLNLTAGRAVDLTHIKGDGGGTQYTFFEAWNAGIPLILNRAWATGPDDEVRDGDCCHMVHDVDGLVEALKAPVAEYDYILEGGKRILAAHSNVGDAYLHAIGG